MGHPSISSVLYLTGDEYSGPTIVFNQTVTNNTDVLADKLWYNKPKNNTFLIFNGDLLHGALPCYPSSSSNDNGNDQHRLTLMVGFWTDKSMSCMSNQKENDHYQNEYIYQPSNPKLPNINDENNTWVKEIITSDYPKIISLSNITSTTTNTNTNVVPIPCHCIQPAWEKIINDEENNNNTTNTM